MVVSLDAPRNAVLFQSADRPRSLMVGAEGMSEWVLLVAQDLLDIAQACRLSAHFSITVRELG